MKTDHEFCIKLIEAVEIYQLRVTLVFTEEKTWTEVTSARKRKNLRTVFARRPKPASNGSSTQNRKPYIFFLSLNQFSQAQRWK